MADPHPVDPEDAYVRGSKEIGEQGSTFSMFMGLAKWGSLVIAALLLLLVLWFQPGGSFVAGLIPAVVMLVAGWFLLKSRPAE